MTQSRSSASEGEIAMWSHVYALLARLWLKEADLPLLDSLHRTNLRDAFTAAGGVVPERSEIDDLAAEYCRLFVGPRQHLAPFQSVWEKGELQSEIAGSVAKFAELLHYHPNREYPVTMVDHLGTQLDIMAFATSPRMRASSPELANEVAGEFFSRHLTWPERLLTAAKTQASSAFYRAVIELTTEFLASQRSVWQMAT